MSKHSEERRLWQAVQQVLNRVGPDDKPLFTPLERRKVEVRNNKMVARELTALLAEVTRTAEKKTETVALRMYGTPRKNSFAATC